MQSKNRQTPIARHVHSAQKSGQSIFSFTQLNICYETIPPCYISPFFRREYSGGYIVVRPPDSHRDGSRAPGAGTYSEEPSGRGRSTRHNAHKLNSCRSSSKKHKADTYTHIRPEDIRRNVRTPKNHTSYNTCRIRTLTQPDYRIKLLKIIKVLFPDVLFKFLGAQSRTAGEPPEAVKGFIIPLTIFKIML